MIKSRETSSGFLSGLFGGGKQQQNVSSNRSTTSSVGSSRTGGSTPNKAVTGSWFGRGKKKKHAAEIDEFFNVKLWASEICLFAFNILTRESRLAALNVAVWYPIDSSFCDHSNRLARSDQSSSW